MLSTKVVVLLLAAVAAALADSSLLDTFEQVDDSALATMAKTHIDGKTLEGCATACREMNSFKCRSFEYEPKSKYCAISALCRRHGLKLNPIKGRLYYEDKMDKDEVIAEEAEADAESSEEEGVHGHEGVHSDRYRDHHLGRHEDGQHGSQRWQRGRGGVHGDRSRDQHSIFPPRRRHPAHADGKHDHDHAAYHSYHKFAAKDCTSFYARKNKTMKSGVYTVHPDLKRRPISVFCDMTTDGGQWTVLSRRVDGSVNFTRTWADYVLGFGSLKGEYWIGLEAMHQLTESGLYELRIEAEATDGMLVQLSYRLFHVASRDDDYRLDVEGHNGTIRNILAPYNRQQFTAYDRTTTTGMHKCAFALHGGWWFSTCQSNSPNGIYVHKPADSADHKYGIAFHRPDGTTVWVKRFEMKIRPAHPAF